MVSKTVLSKIIYNLKYLNKTIESSYGGGVLGYVRFLHTSFFKKNIFYVYVVELAKFQCKENVDGVAYSDDICYLQKYRNNKQLPKQYYMDELDSLEHCCFVLHENEIAHIHWIVRSGEASRFLEIDEGHVEINHVLTLPEYRNLHFYRNSIIISLSKIKKMNITHAFMVINSDTIISRHVVEDIGWKLCGKIKTIGRFNIKLNSSYLVNL